MAYKKVLSRKNLWDACPAPLRRVFGGVLGQVPMGLLLGRHFRKVRAFAGQAERWPAARAREYQLQKVKEILAIASGTPFYSHLWRQAGVSWQDLKSLEDLKDFPIISKQDVREHARDMCVPPAPQAGCDEIATGGTSGDPLVFYMDRRRHGAEYAYLTQSWGRVGYRPGDTLAVLRGRMVQPDRSGLLHELDPLLRQHFYSSFHLSDENLGRYLEHIATIGPCFLHAYPSSAAALARYCRRNGIRGPANIRAVILESENVYGPQREMVQEVLGCRYFSCYGHTEKLVMAAECEHSTDYHVWPTYGYFELLNERGSPVATPGQQGEIVGTGFINRVMPFIRYRTGDWATYVGDRCEACGRQHPIIRDIRGHNLQEVLIGSDGTPISWAALNMHDDTFDRVRQFQFRQHEPGRAVLRVVPADGFDEMCRQRIQTNMGRKLDGRLSFTIELVPAIPLSSRGKTIYVDQHIPGATEDIPLATG